MNCSRFVTKKGKALCFLTLLVLFNSCTLSFRGEEIFQPPFHWPPVPRAEPKTVRLDITFQVAVDQKIMEDNPRDYSQLVQMAHAAYKQSELFKEIRIGQGETDRVVEITVSYQTERNLRTLSRWTFGIIPSKETIREIAVATIKDSDGKVLDTIKKTAETVSYTQLLLLATLPIHGLISDHEFNNEVQHSGMEDSRLRRCGVWPEGIIICRRRSVTTWPS